MGVNNPIRITQKEWFREAMNRASELKDVKFVCPSCGYQQSCQDLVDTGMEVHLAEARTAFSCIGRWLDSCQDAFTDGPGPCNYAGGGLIGLNPIHVVNDDGDEILHVFNFAVDPLTQTSLEVLAKHG